ncbi:pyrroloquinoline quinone biosynthesis protein PqqB [Caenispirillum bisanense]|uniref:Coenzyme PQQ synthesis protein B n=1 Tax=Caenispirillum bisanense TaxID=414052 RepID=A0A286GDU0_9PROT|nr:pyrroloquinoline quinone biosynthesis protein PqqB [Caenispirillum bisanense]SOD93667.1 pyrroloquinoline quinone biosynthesis protein B [Caenispirillum bisanense]
MLRILVLGAGAGGGFPQWNCGCAQCRRARAGDPAAPVRTQSSIAVSADGQRWVLVNASPDLGRQLLDRTALHPVGGLRHSPVAAVVVTNADVDHVAGLLTLRESHAFPLYATRRVHDILGANAIFNVLNPEYVARRPLAPHEPEPLADATGDSLGLSVELFPVPGKIALWLEDPTKPGFGSVPEDTVGVKITETATGRHVFYIPGCASLPPDLGRRIDGAPLVLFDGTTFTDDEMAAHKVGTKTAARMGHMAMSGPDGSLTAFAPLRIDRKVYIHINNTNPVLVADTAARRVVEEAGWEVAYDGMEIVL